MYEGMITVRLTENQDSAVWYGMRQLIGVKPEMYQACRDIRKPISKGLSYRLTFGQYAIMLAAATQFAEDGHSPGDNQMLVDAERAMYRFQAAGEKKGWPFESQAYVGNNPCDHKEKEQYEGTLLGKPVIWTGCKVCGEQLDHNAKNLKD